MHASMPDSIVHPINLRVLVCLLMSKLRSTDSMGYHMCLSNICVSWPGSLSLSQSECSPYLDTMWAHVPYQTSGPWCSESRWTSTSDVYRLRTWYDFTIKGDLNNVWVWSCADLAAEMQQVTVRGVLLYSGWKQDTRCLQRFLEVQDND